MPLQADGASLASQLAAAGFRQRLASDPLPSLSVDILFRVIVLLIVLALYLALRARSRSLQPLLPPWAWKLLSPHVGTPIEALCDPRVPLIVLVNAHSGGGLGSTLARCISQLRSPPAVFPLSRDGLLEAMNTVTILRGRGLQPRLICAGGDGTVTAVIRSLLEWGHANVPVCVLPLGTGNDCARSLRTPACRFTSAELRSWFAAVSRARVVQSDVWDVSFETSPHGAIVCVRGGVETQLSETAVKGIALNYISVGEDARLCFTVEVHRRSHSRAWMNKAIYVAAGVARMCGWGGSSAVTANLDSVDIDGVRHVSNPSVAASEGDKVRSLREVVSGACATLLCVCGGSYASGVDVWSHATSSSSHWTRQRRDDAQFEFMAARTLAQLGLTVATHRAVCGGIQRIAQPRALSMTFIPASSQEVGDSARGAAIAPAVLIPQAADAHAPIRAPAAARLPPALPRSSRTAALTLAFGRIARNVGARVRRVLPTRQGTVLAPPETDDEHVHARGYAMAPRGALTVPTQSLLTPTSSVGMRSPGTPVRASLQSPDAAVEESVSPISQQHEEEGVQIPVTPSAPVMVRQGRELGHTTPTYLQIDGEGYKLYGLRNVSIQFRTRVLMVTFADGGEQLASGANA